MEVKKCTGADRLPRLPSRDLSPSDRRTEPTHTSAAMKQTDSSSTDSHSVDSKSKDGELSISAGYNHEALKRLLIVKEFVNILLQHSGQLDSEESTFFDEPLSKESLTSPASVGGLRNARQEGSTEPTELTRLAKNYMHSTLFSSDIDSPIQLLEWPGTSRLSKDEIKKSTNVINDSLKKFNETNASVGLGDSLARKQNREKSSQRTSRSTPLRKSTDLAAATDIWTPQSQGIPSANGNSRSVCRPRAALEGRTMNLLLYTSVSHHLTIFWVGIARDGRGLMIKRYAQRSPASLTSFLATCKTNEGILNKTNMNLRRAVNRLNVVVGSRLQGDRVSPILLLH
jgi:hypothetical protein